MSDGDHAATEPKTPALQFQLGFDEWLLNSEEVVSRLLLITKLALAYLVVYHLWYSITWGIFELENSRGLSALDWLLWSITSLVPGQLIVMLGLVVLLVLWALLEATRRRTLITILQYFAIIVAVGCLGVVIQVILKMDKEITYGYLQVALSLIYFIVELVGFVAIAYFSWKFNQANAEDSDERY